MISSANRSASAPRSDSFGDPENKFRALVQSPLRAGLLRFLAARSGEAFDVESLMATFGRMRRDVENCLRELVEFGVAGRTASSPAQYLAVRPENAAVDRLLENFLERRAD